MSRSLASPQFPGDDGGTDPLLADVLERGGADVLAVLPMARLFVPVVALLGETPSADGDKDAEMAAVLMTGADGRTALLTFSSVAAMQAWDPAARPVPILGADAARAALDEGATAMLLDLAHPHMTVVETDDVRHLAQGHRLLRTDDGTAWVAG